MAKHIEEILNDCFERLLSGENYESCLRRYPEHAAELDIMLRTVFDVKRRIYPIQPRPEFKYWSRVRMQGVQDYIARQPAESKPSAFHWKRSWAVALTAILVIVLASGGGTAAAASESLPDQPLYGVKLAVEQALVTLTFSDSERAELHARLAEKRAQEIAVMASEGKTDKVITTITRMNFQLEQANISLQKYDTLNVPPTPAAGSVSSPSPTQSSVTAPSPAQSFDAKTSSPEKDHQETSKPDEDSDPLTPAVNRARTAVTTTNAHSLVLLQNALEKAPDNVKPTIREQIERTKKINDRIQTPTLQKPEQKPVNQHQKANTNNTKQPDNDDQDDRDPSGPGSPSNKSNSNTALPAIKHGTAK